MRLCIKLADKKTQTADAARKCERKRPNADAKRKKAKDGQQWRNVNTM